MYSKERFLPFNHMDQNNILHHLHFHSKAFTKIADYPPNSYYIINLSSINELFSYSNLQKIKNSNLIFQPVLFYTDFLAEIKVNLYFLAKMIEFRK